MLFEITLTFGWKKQQKKTGFLQGKKKTWRSLKLSIQSSSFFLIWKKYFLLLFNYSQFWSRKGDCFNSSLFASGVF